MAAAAVDSLTAELGAKAQVDAANRDYIVEPRLGTGSVTYCLGLEAPWSLRILSVDACRHEMMNKSGADYNTVGGVSGPLVIVESVKVRVSYFRIGQERTGLTGVESTLHQRHYSSDNFYFAEAEVC